MAEAELDELRERLEAAEQLCLMFSWTAPSEFTRDGKACHQLYRRWLKVSGVVPARDQHPELGEDRLNDLAAEYDGKQAWTLPGEPGNPVAGERQDKDRG